MSANDDDDDDNDVDCDCDCDGNAIERASEIDLIDIAAVAFALAHMNYLNELRKLSCSMKRHS